MAKSPFVKPKIEGPRKRIPVDETLRAEARAGMGGEQTRIEAEEKAAAPAADAVAAVVATPEPAPVPPAPTPAPVVELTPPPAAAAPVEVQSDQIAPTSAPATVEGGPRGRKPAAVETEPSGELKGVRISEADWAEIRRIIVQLPKGADMPTNIIGYLHAAHLHYKTHLQKQGKLAANL